MNTSHGCEEDGKMEHQSPVGLYHMSLLKTQYFCKQNVLWTERHTRCPEEMKFHDNSEESINRRALVQAEWWGGVKSAGPLIKKKQSSSLSLQHNGILDGCLHFLMRISVHIHKHIYTDACKRAHKQGLAHTHPHKIEFLLDCTMQRLLLHCAKLPKAGELSSALGLKCSTWEVNSTTHSCKIYMIIPIKGVMESHADFG